MNEYEVAVIYDPDLEIDLAKAEDRVKKIFLDNKVTITKTDNWGKRMLAYPIKKHESGIYVIYSVSIDPNCVMQIEASLNITDEVIRFLITKPDLKKRAKAELERADKARKQEARQASGSAVDEDKKEED